MNIFSVVFINFLILKIAGIVDWNWSFVFLPVMVKFLFLLGVAHGETKKQ